MDPPTGYGKSLCALRGKVDSSTVVRVSPLLLLMVDQRDKFSPRVYELSL